MLIWKIWLHKSTKRDWLIATQLLYSSLIWQCIKTLYTVPCLRLKIAPIRINRFFTKIHIASYFIKKVIFYPKRNYRFFQSVVFKQYVNVEDEIIAKKVIQEWQINFFKDRQYESEDGEIRYRTDDLLLVFRGKPGGGPGWIGALIQNVMYVFRQLNTPAFRYL